MSLDSDLSRFVQAQAGCFAQVREELRLGEKRSHWMWFVFPQIEGLGRSSIAQRYAIEDIDEARAYLQYDLLGERLVACTRLVLAHSDRSAFEIFGHPDCLKFRSSMTLFSAAAGTGSVFEAALDCFFDGEPDPGTLCRLPS